MSSPPATSSPSMRFDIRELWETAWGKTEFGVLKDVLRVHPRVEWLWFDTAGSFTVKGFDGGGRMVFSVTTKSMKVTMAALYYELLR